jgi:hypothetical protein
MQSITKKCFGVPVLLFLSACSNALYFYETDKISLTVEARPDSSQPVQGNLGIKQRVALVTPAKKNAVTATSVSTTEKASSDGDALSVISSFRFKIEEEPGFNPVSIQTAFITGEAASGLEQSEATVATEVLNLTEEQLKQQNVAVAEISKLNNNDLQHLFTCFGFPEEKSKNLARRYGNLTEGEFKKKFKSDFRFEAEKMLNKFNQCAGN